MVVVTVDDDGPGIPPHALERIFERFYTDRPNQGFGQNSGLGLSISRQIIGAHGGQSGRQTGLPRPRTSPAATIGESLFVTARAINSSSNYRPFPHEFRDTRKRASCDGSRLRRKWSGRPWRIGGRQKRACAGVARARQNDRTVWSADRRRSDLGSRDRGQSCGIGRASHGGAHRTPRRRRADNAQRTGGGDQARCRTEQPQSKLASLARRTRPYPYRRDRRAAPRA